jgi:hypothetical protein
MVLGVGLLMLSALSSPACAQTEVAASLSEPNVSARKIFIMLFLMLGPIKILVPFVNLTKNAECGAGIGRTAGREHPGVFQTCGLMRLAKWANSAAL